MTTRALLVSIAVLFLFSCSREIDIIYPDPLFPESALFKATLLIRIMDESGRPIPGARVHLGPFVKESDYHGWVQWFDAKVTSSAYIKVEKDGFFMASRRIYPSASAPNYVSLMLLYKSKTVSFSSSNDRSVWMEGNFELHFPKEAYQLENGDPYSGDVVVFAHSLPVDDPDMSFKMPGNLTGLNKDNALGQLASLGMIAVELQTTTGQKLEIRKGQTVEIKFPVSEERISKVPDVLPMWYFDEEPGVWKEEGQALLTGNYFIANVAHFSFWNCDDYFELIHWGAGFQNQYGLPLTYGKVCLTIDALNTKACEYLDQDGNVNGGVAAHEIMSMQVYSSCGEEVFSTKIGPFDQDIVTGPYLVDDPSYNAHLTGTVYACDLQPVKQGYVLINTGVQLYQVPLNGSGSFSMDIYSCQSYPISVQAFDASHLATSTLRSIPYSPVINMDTIMACILNEEYIVLDAEGMTYPFFTSPHTIWGKPNDDCILNLNVEQSPYLFDLCLKKDHPGYYPNTKCFLEMDIQNIPDTIFDAVAESMDLKIERFDNPGGMVSGSFTGKLRFEYIDYASTGNYLLLPFKGEFNVRRK